MPHPRDRLQSPPSCIPPREHIRDPAYAADWVAFVAIIEAGNGPGRLDWGRAFSFVREQGFFIRPSDLDTIDPTGALKAAAKTYVRENCNPVTWDCFAHDTLETWRCETPEGSGFRVRRDLGPR